MKNEKMTPRIRFKGFTDAWEQRKLEDILVEYSEKSKVEDEYDLLSSTNKGIEKRLGRTVSSSNKGYKILKRDAVVLSPQNLWLGNINFNDSFNKGLVSPSYKTFNVRDDFNKIYVKYLVKQPYMLYQYKLSSVQGASVVRRNLEIDSFYNIRILTPCINEQSKIGNLINNIQKLIDFNGENLQNYNKLIRLLNSYIFNEVFKSKNNHNAWNEQKLSEVVDIFDGTHQTPTYTEYGIPFYSVENIKNMETNKYISKNDFFKEFKNVPEFGDIFLTRIGDVGTSNVYTKKESAAYYVSLALLKTKSINSNYLHALLNSNNMQRNIWKKTLHVAFPKKINKNEIGKLSAMMTTNIYEQEQIGKLFKIINLKINFINNKLQNLKTLKKYLMQNLFI